jgi:hypothetical protein
MGGTNDPPERNEDQDDDLKAGEEVRALALKEVDLPSICRS